MLCKPEPGSKKTSGSEWAAGAEPREGSSWGELNTVSSRLRASVSTAGLTFSRGRVSNRSRVTSRTGVSSKGRGTSRDRVNSRDGVTSCGGVSSRGIVSSRDVVNSKGRVSSEGGMNIKTWVSSRDVVNSVIEWGAEWAVWAAEDKRRGKSRGGVSRRAGMSNREEVFGPGWLVLELLRRNLGWGNDGGGGGGVLKPG